MASSKRTVNTVLLYTGIVTMLVLIALLSYEAVSGNSPYAKTLIVKEMYTVNISEGNVSLEEEVKSE